MGLDSGQFYIGTLDSAGNLTLTLTDQETDAISLVVADGMGAPEFFDTAYGKTDIAAGTSLGGDVGLAAQLGAVSLGTTASLTGGALVADSEAA